MFVRTLAEAACSLSQKHHMKFLKYMSRIDPPLQFESSAGTASLTLFFFQAAALPHHWSFSLCGTDKLVL
jgi:hypothetical protein